MFEFRNHDLKLLRKCTHTAVKIKNYLEVRPERGLLDLISKAPRYLRQREWQKDILCCCKMSSLKKLKATAFTIPN